MKRRIAEVLAVLALACLLVDTGYTQVTMAAIRGKATDNQGAVLPGATVTARHVATNTTKVAVTTDVGQYYLPNLPAGQYEVSHGWPDSAAFAARASCSRSGRRSASTSS